MEYKFKNLKALAEDFESTASQLRQSIRDNSKLSAREVSKRKTMAYIWESAAEIVQHTKFATK